MRIMMKTMSGELPRYETEGSAGMDIKAYLDGPVEIKPGERALIPTGLFMEIPEGYEVQIRARSGLAVRHGIGLTNGVGTIDSDYDGDRIAQMVVARYEKAQLVQAEELSETVRGEGGFGHTGI